MSKSYRDTEELKGLMDDIKESKSFEQAVYVIDQYLRGWLLYSINGYSEDYPHFSANWKVICDKVNTTPKKIIIVRELHFTPEYSILNNLCDFLTTLGFCVRREGEFIKCTECGDAIPSHTVWTVLKGKGIKVPKKWQTYCSKHDNRVEDSKAEKE